MPPSERTPPRRASGPAGRLVFGSSRELREDPLGLLLRAQREFGDVVRFRYLGPFAWHLFAHPDDVNHILSTHDRDFPKGAFGRILDLIIPGGLASTDDATWARQRRLIQPGFHSSSITALGDTVVSIAEDHLAEWRRAADRSGAIDMAEACMRLSFDAASRALLGSDLRGVMPVVHRYAALALERLHDRVLRPLSIVPWLPSPGALRYRAAVQAVNRAIGAVVAHRRRHGAGSRDLLNMLLTAHDDEGQGFSDHEVSEQIKTLLISGYETTGTTLLWLFYNLSRHPDVERRVRGEIEAVIGTRRPAVGDLPALGYTRQVLNETLRLYPPAPWLGRQARRATTVNGYPVPRGGVVSVSPFVTHRHPAFWREPEAFDPDRFGPGPAEQRPRGAFFPFGIGPRFCVGQSFAMMEIMLTIALVVPRCRFRQADAAEIRPRFRGTLQPATAVFMRIGDASSDPEPRTPDGSGVPA